MPKCTKNGSNYFFIELGDNKYCFSYTSCVAAIINGTYEEYDGDKYYSPTSNKHKALFRAYYNVER